MYPNRHPGPPPAAGQPFKFTVAETCDRIKEEFSYLQAQYHRDTVSLKLECEKLASEKTEMQRHYVMYYEMSYGLNVEMHKQFPFCFPESRSHLLFLSISFDTSCVPPFPKSKKMKKRLEGDRERQQQTLDQRTRLH
ncbi:hypothetical protein JTE90_018850 [Oedothorax gibbosus]|uniref:Groucho/TLE N-terminal Q-rich domain-containing protein n=1 Tax=Oedothorax gibbosus TaxID=931172 RepID=A0AAV6UVQ0_9ARAC|nr:hypothetical protein JTE90_018850 [Oedothorax gibbosus]